MPESSSQSDDADLSPSTVQVTSQDGNDERGTPVEFIRTLQDAIGGLFDLDPCSGAEPVQIAETRFTKEDNGLAQSWAGYDTVYCNPPYSELESWLKKVTREASRDEDAPNLILTLLPGNTSTQWFHNHATLADYLVLIEGRLTFNGTNQSAPFASILCAFGEPDESVLDTLNQLGAVYTRAEVEAAQKQARLDDLFSADGGGVATVSETGMAPSLGPSGPTIRDVSMEAPAVPQGIIDFREIGLNDILSITRSDNIIGTGLPNGTEYTARVLSGEPANKPETHTPEDWQTILCVDPSTEPDTYICLQQNPTDLTDIHMSVSPNTLSWTYTPLKSLYRVEANGRPVIEPYGEGTSLIC